MQDMADESNPQEPTTTKQGSKEAWHSSQAPMPEVRRLKRYDKLMKNGATNLWSSTDLMEIEHWMWSAERVFDQMECIPEECLDYVASLSQDDVLIGENRQSMGEYIRTFLTGTKFISIKFEYCKYEITLPIYLFDTAHNFNFADEIFFLRGE